MLGLPGFFVVGVGLIVGPRVQIYINASAVIMPEA